MDMASDPPPDLAIEADVTSKTTLEAYAILEVPDVWICNNGKLTVYRLDHDDYQQSTESTVFPNMPMAELSPRLVTQAFATGTSTMRRDLRQQLQSGEIALGWSLGDLCLKARVRSFLLKTLTRKTRLRSQSGPLVVSQMRTKGLGSDLWFFFIMTTNRLV